MLKNKYEEKVMSSYKDHDLKSYLDKIIGNKSTPESQLQAVEELGRKWSLDPDMVESLRMLIRALDENIPISYIMVYSMLVMLCPDNTMSCISMEMPFSNTIRKVQFSIQTSTISVDPKASWNDLDVPSSTRH